MALNELWILTLEALCIRFEPQWRSETKRSLKRRTALQWTRRHPSRHLNIHLRSIMQATVHTALISIHFLFSHRLVFGVSCQWVDGKHTRPPSVMP